MSQKPDLAQWIDLERVDENKPFAGTYEGDDVVLVRDGTHVRAVAGRCTHMGAPLEDGVVIEGEVRCPWHHARFEIETGCAVGGPAIEGLGCFAVEAKDGRIRVTGKRHRGRAGASLEAPTPVVVIGSGAAGYAVVDGLTRAGCGGDVVLLTADEDAPYERTYLSKDLLSGDADEHACRLPDLTALDGTAPEVRLGTRISMIDTERRTVVTEAGEELGYGTLVLATGAEPIVPDFEGKDREDVLTLRSLADAERLTRAADEAKAVGILGSSFIGLEVAAQMVGRGLDVHVVSRSEVPLAGVLGDDVGAHLRSLHEDNGVVFHLERSVDAYDGETLTLDDGTKVAADLLVVGAGVRPRVELAKEAGIELAPDGDGIEVDGSFQTSVADVYAVGDIAHYPDPRLGRSIRVEHWVHAQRQGESLARRLLGQANEDFGATPFFWTGHYGEQISYVGHAAKAEHTEVEGDVADGDYAVWIAEDGENVAQVSAGRSELALETEARWEQG